MTEYKNGVYLSSWDKYFYEMCKIVSLNSKCLSRKIGAVITFDNSVISTGYNGPPRGVPHCNTRYTNDKRIIEKMIEHKIELTGEVKRTCPRKVFGFKSGEGLDNCIAGHAERNALINAARNGVSVNNATMYAYCPIPCSPCLIEIINAGIKEIVVTDLSYYDEQGEWLVKESGIVVRKFAI